jgi:CRP-like cAMP-binding protein
LTYEIDVIFLILTQVNGWPNYLAEREHLPFHGFRFCTYAVGLVQQPPRNGLACADCGQIKRGCSSHQHMTSAPLPPKPSLHALALSNHLLAAICGDDLQRWLPCLQVVDLPLGKVLYEAGELRAYGYFPTTAIVSLLADLENGSTAEIAVIGREGFVGISMFMGGGSAPYRAVVQSAGLGLRLPALALMDAFNIAGSATRALLRYAQALITQIAQTAVCNRHHSLEKQLCRWLLLSLDRLDGNELVMTQELIANMLGVRREGVTEAALKLQRDGLIAYHRGHITVIDRPGLEVRCCECYAVVKKEYDRLLAVNVAT